MAVPVRALAGVHCTTAVSCDTAACTFVAAPFDAITRHGSPRNDPHGGNAGGNPAGTDGITGSTTFDG